MASSKVNPPDPMDFSRPDSWPMWRQRYERYRLCTKLNKEDGEIQVSNLIYVMGMEADRIFSTFTFARPAEGQPDPKDNYDTVMNKFHEYFIPRRNVVHERSKFHSRQQEEGEPIEHFIRSLYELSEFADFKEQRDENIRDRLVLGIRDKELTRKLQLETDLDLKKAIEISRHFELVTSQIGEQKESIDYISGARHKEVTMRRQEPMTQKAQSDVDHVKNEKRTQKTHNPRKPFDENDWYDSRHDSKQAAALFSCGNCGYTHAKGRCPAFGKECNFCHNVNHFARACRKKLRSANARSTPSQNSQRLHQIESCFEEFQIPAVTSENKQFVGQVHTEPPWTVKLRLNAQLVDLKIDTGADVSVLSSQSYNTLNPKPKLKKSNVTLRSPGGIAKCIGRFSTTAKLGEDYYDIEFYVIQGTTDNLLSREASKRMNLIQKLNSCTASEIINPAIFGPLTEEPVKAEPVKICLTDRYEPYSLHTARRVPIPLLDKVKNELTRLKEMNIIEEINEPTDWCSPMVPVQKKSGGVRICSDYKKLNTAIKRERYIIPTLDDILHKLQGSKVFSKLDATAGFHQLKLDDSTAKLTTFISPFGRYFYRRMPFGISSAPEIFQRTIESILQNQDHVIVYFDDILVHSENIEMHKKHLKETVDKLHASNLKLNQEKCEFFKDEIEFLGYIINQHGSKPDPKKVEAICQMPEPENLDDVRRLLGMVNFLCKYLPNLSSTLRPITELLEKNRAWTWGSPQSKAFEQVKNLLTNSPTLAFYDPKRPTTVSSDSSSYGIAGVLLQNHNGVMKPVAYCSRTLTATERRYAQIEKELLAVVWSCERFQRYLVGLEHFQIETDHKPLIPLINTKDLSETPIRCQRMLMRLLRFKITAHFTPGKYLLVSDHLSRSPLKSTEENDFQNEVYYHVHSITSTWPVSDSRLQRIRQDTQKDINLKYAFDYTINGWPAYKEDVKLAARDFYSVRGELSVVDGLLVRDTRIVIPYDMRAEILDILHQGHQGLTKCRQFANQSVWWPGISKDLQQKVASCRYCVEKQPANRHEPMIPSELPDRPFQKVGVDICDFKGEHFLVCVDYYSRWIDIENISRMTSHTVINKLKSIFASHGIPETLISDNGPQFSSSEFARFAQEWNFRHVTSSPHFPQSNGEAERAVKTAKEILRQPAPIKALLMYRSTPIPTLGLSPSEMAMGRKLRTVVPTLPQNLNPAPIDNDVLRERDIYAKFKQKQNFDSHYGASPLPELQPGDRVLVRLDGERGGWKLPAEVKKKCDSVPRSYLLQTPTGLIRRNRKHLRLLPSGDEDSLLHGYVPVIPPKAFSPYNQRQTMPETDLEYSNGQSTPHADMDLPTPMMPTTPRPPSHQMSRELPRSMPCHKPPLLASPRRATMLPQPQHPSTNIPNPSPITFANDQPDVEPSYRTRSGRAVRRPARYCDNTCAYNQQNY